MAISPKKHEEGHFCCIVTNKRIHGLHQIVVGVAWGDPIEIFNDRPLLFQPGPQRPALYVRKRLKRVIPQPIVGWR